MKIVRWIPRVLRYSAVIVCCSLGFISIVATGGGGGGGGSVQPTPQPTPLSPTLGYWSGENISFNLNEGSLLVDNLSLTYRYTPTSGKCAGMGITRTVTNNASIEVNDNKFTWETPSRTANGEFKSETTVEVQFTWSSYNSYCDILEEGSALLYAYHSEEQETSYKISSAYLQYRNYEDPDRTDGYAAWAGITKDGEPVNAADIKSLTITNIAGDELVPDNQSFYRGPPYHVYDCRSTTCTGPEIVIDSGYIANFSNIPAGSYHFQAEATNGEKFGRHVYFPGKVVLPFIPVETYSWSWTVQGDSVASWGNPTGEPNWGEVDQILLTVLDEDTNAYIWVRLNPSVETFTIPESWWIEADTLGRNHAWWLVQTRAFDSNNMNYARGITY
jgi:hypothetical protein